MSYRYTLEGGEAKAQKVSLEPLVGELLQGIGMSAAQFKAARKELGGMNETAGAITVADLDNAAANILTLANVAQVDVEAGSDDLCFAAWARSSHALVLLTVNGNTNTFTVNSEKSVLASNLVKALKSCLQQ